MHLHALSYSVRRLSESSVTPTSAPSAPGAERAASQRGGAAGSGPFLVPPFPMVLGSGGTCSSTNCVPGPKPAAPPLGRRRRRRHPRRRHGRCGRGRLGEATAMRHEAGQRGHRAGHRQPAPGKAGRAERGGGGRRPATGLVGVGEGGAAGRAPPGLSEDSGVPAPAWAVTLDSSRPIFFFFFPSSV